MTLVELMVGMVVGLAMVATAIYFLVGFGIDNRRMLLEARLSQDMRAAMDIVTRDLRRAGYWQNAQSVYAAASSATDTTGCMVAAMAFATATPASSAATYAYSKDADNTVSAAERFGVRLNGDVLQMNLGSNFQDLTDRQTTTVTGFTVTPTVTDVAVPCAAASCPAVQIREYALVLTAHAANDPAVQRTLRSSVRLRNDLVRPATVPASAACP